jgi:DNA replication initiation complex subunit (GINS family)
MELDVDSLGELLRKERSTPFLQPVAENFYNELRNLFKKVEETYPPHSRERENLRNLVGDIFNSREKKLVLFAVSFSRSGEKGDIENATPEEEKFLHGLIDTLRSRRARLLEKKRGKGEEKIQDKKKKPESKAEGKGEGKAPNGVVTLRILQDLPPIVGVDGKTYGSFSSEDIVALPERNASIFLKHGYGERIDFDS